MKEIKSAKMRNGRRSGAWSGPYTLLAVADIFLLLVLAIYSVSDDPIRTVIKTSRVEYYIRGVVLEKSTLKSVHNFENSKGPTTSLPNILGYGDVGYNGGNAETTHLDAMAAGPNTVHLTRYYSGSPVCSPTRGTVLTGRNHNRYCIWNANIGSGDNSRPQTMPLPPTEITVAEILKNHGYQTAMFGKWHLGDFEKFPGGNKK